ncbi:MAG TPA: hypothetical protein VMP00_11045 [Burkholderiales bacterium]|nr:hypothetical protein [Burkholderiales bacterium]
MSYVWTRAEITALLGETDARRFFGVYELVPMPEQTAPGVRELPSRDGQWPGELRIRLPIERTVQAV